MKKLVIVFMFFSVSMTSYSQINELGVFAGGSNYIGDIGRTNYIYPNSYALGLIYKWNMHPHFTLRANYTYSKVRGNDEDSDNSFRYHRSFRGDGEGGTLKEWLNFENDIHELVAGIEYHFFKYNLSKTGHTNTPYLFAELGAVNYGVFDSETGGSSRTTNFTMPFGAGFKTILAPGVGIGFEVGFRYTFKDDIDGYPYLDYQQGDNIQINPNNNDWYVFTGITLVFAFGREGCYTGSF